MSKQKPFSHPRWNDPPQAKVIGHVELTEEEKCEADDFLEKKIKEHRAALKKNKKQK